MRLVSEIEVFLPADIVERSPTVWERLTSLWKDAEPGAELVRNQIEAATFVFEFRKALDALRVDNARVLVVDGLTVFHDARGVNGDLPDMLVALSEHVRVFGETSRELRFSVEHEEAGLRLALEATVSCEHRKDRPAARIKIAGQPSDLDPQPNESSEAYRARIEPFLSNSKGTVAIRLQFGAFVSRVEAELSSVFPEIRFTSKTEALDVALLYGEPEPLVAEEGEESERPKARSVINTAAPQRNFTLSSEQRMAALMGGPPRYAVRLRSIEDLEAELREALGRHSTSQSIPIAVARKMEELNRLIVEHNRYYPIESNLPADIATGELTELGKPWRPRPIATIDSLRRRSR